MPHFRLIIRGHWDPRRQDYAGFFTNRIIRAETLDEAADRGLEALSREWRITPFLHRGGADLKLEVLDGWRISRLTAWRKARGGHTFYATEEEMADAASIEAQASNAPKDACIWRTATPPDSITSELFVLD